MTDFSLVDAEQFHACVAASPHRESPLVLEAHFSSFDHPLDGDEPVRHHIPGAIQVHPSYLEAGADESRYYPHYQCPGDGNILPPEELVAALALLGITPKREVWVYGTEPDGIMAAARLIWGLMHAGIQTIRLLDGGITAWLDYGGPTVSSIPSATELAQSAQGLPRECSSWLVDPDVLASEAEVKEILLSESSGSGRIVDVRRPGEYDGTETKYYPFFSKAGHIPGAVLQGNWINLVEESTGKIGPALESVRRRWTDLRIVDEKVERGETSLIFYCGTGWRSSLSFLVATLLGYRAKNFDDGFYGWSWTGENDVSYRKTEGTALEV
ncbi:MAG: rhodanese-like domain-containing protein [Verrucomicrobiota bacterium]